MTVRVNKSSFNIREKLSELERPIGLKGSELMRAETAQDARDLVSAGRRNLIINGAMQVAQRGTTFTGLTSPTFIIDRFDLYITNGTFSSEQSTTAPPGFGNSLKIDCTATTSLGTSGTVLLRQKFEGLNVQSIKKGTSDAQPITVSFWVRSNKTGTYILEMYDADNTRQVSKSYTINSADTWEHKTLTFPADTTGTLTNDNSRSIIAQFWLAAGTNYTSGTLNTSWNSITTANRIVGQVNFADSTSNEWYITGVQLEVGKNATEFEHRSFGEELALCQRYYQKSYNYSQPPGAGTSSGSEWFTREGASGRIVTTTSFQVQMRATPTFKLYDWAGNVDRVRTSSGNNQTITESYAHEKKITVGKTASISELLYQWYAEAEI